MKLLTRCQAMGIRVGVEIVKGHPAKSGMKSPTGCQINRTRVDMRMVRRYPVDLA